MTAAVDVGGVPIAWEAHGPVNAPGLVLLHSLGSDRSMWRPQIEALCDDHRIIVVDTRGHGRSGAPPGAYTLPTLAGDVLAAADAAGLDRFHLCGLSLGGQMALWLAIHRPERLLSVIACNTAAKIGDAEGWNARIAAIRNGGMASIRDAVIERWFAPGFAERRPEWFAEAQGVFAATDADGYIGCCAALAVSDLRNDLDQIRVPALIVGGSVDLATTPSDAEALHAAIPGSELLIIEGGAHVSNLDEPESFTTAVRTFLAGR